MKVDILIPVYDGYEETVQCIESVLQSDLGENITLSVINDCSPNEALTAWLRTAAEQYQFGLYENEENLGFVQTVNRGMKLHQDCDVILLNSDTVVAGDWVARMQAHVAQDKRISSVTPFSNNATICSFPNFCEENTLLPYAVEDIDRAFAHANKGQLEEIPTAIGFCMYITRASIEDVGYFDAETFGRGYGEENDFCMRTRQAGWKHVVAADVFVAHVGGVSFSEEKEARVAAAQEVLDQLYPEYHGLVQDFVVSDPLIRYRVQAYIELMKVVRPTKTMLLISHRLGGGVEKHVRELHEHLGRGGFLPIIRAGETADTCEFSCSPLCKDKIIFRIPEDYQKLYDLCDSIGVGRVYIHHTMGISPELLRLIPDLKVAMDFMVHDYYMINANPTLTAKDGRFCDDIDVRDECCAEHYELPFGIDAVAWRENQAAFLAQCEHVWAPSQYTAALFKHYFQHKNMQVVYHPDSLEEAYPDPELKAWDEERPLKVLVIGALSKEKGADILEAAALYAQKHGMSITFHLLGYGYRPLQGVVEHGAYTAKDIVQKIDDICPDLMWYPALWPETYSYTLSEGLRCACPIVASDLGAFPERLEGRLMSAVYDWKSSPEDWVHYILGFMKQGLRQQESNDSWRLIYQDSKAFYHNFWDMVPSKPTSPTDFSTLKLDKIGEHLTFKEKLLLVLLRIRNKKIVSMTLKLVPASIKQKLIRGLSKQPLQNLLIRNDNE